ncbi:MAG: chemotaxis protein CheW [Desulfitobacteriia bacterium]
MNYAGGKYLTFNLEEEVYAIPILKVKEIIGIMDITEVPGMPEFIKGVINLRGRIIPVLDLRVRLGIAAKEYNKRTCIIVVDLPEGKRSRVMGVIVDTVAEVVNILAAEIEKPPGYSSDLGSDYIEGIGKIKGKIIILLNIEKILREKTLS